METYCCCQMKFSLFYAALKKCSNEVIHVTSQTCQLIGWVAKDGWNHYKAHCNLVAESGIMMAQCNLQGSEPFYGVMRPLDFQEARWFLSRWCGVDLFGGRQVFLY